MLVLSLGKLRIAVPDVRGMTPEAARTAIKKQGLSVDPAIHRKHNPTVPKGRVINTLPHPTTAIPKDQPVALYVSLGPPKVQVPRIDPGTPYQDAVTALRDAHLKPVKGPRQYSDEPVGTVVSVSPTGTVTEFSPVTITVSKGPPMVAVPEISSGTPLGAAEAALRHAGLNWDVQKVYGGFLGRVVRTDPPSGTEVRVGSTVTLTVV
jgi:serine/threonine-protein kinase